MAKYTEQNEYLKHSDCDSGEESCVCCPIGTVMSYSECGKEMGCVTPQDFEQIEIAKLVAPEGYVKAMHPITNEFLGFLTAADYAIVIAAIPVP